jgi:fructose-bisphosphate aldolase class I
MASELTTTAEALVAQGKGILAADESTGTMKKRLDAIGVESTEENRRYIRELLFTADGIGDFISGVILFDETFRQSTADGTPFPEALAERGIIPGIKVDAGAKPLAGSPDEKVTEGLDGLRERLEEYAGGGARFAKWRGVIAIEGDLPTRNCIDVNAHALARYAALCQEAGVTPIVEPEVLMDGDHTIERAREVTAQTLRAVFDALSAQWVKPEGMLLKPNMVMSGYEADTQASVEEVARTTIDCLREVVPPAVPGIVFLSGGQSDERAMEHLNAMNAIGGAPWELSFSYGRALQGGALEAWSGSESNAPAARAAFHHRARCTSAARSGSYSSAMEGELAAAS